MKYQYETHITSHDGDYVWYYEIYKKKDTQYTLFEESDQFFDDKTQCDLTADKRCSELDKTIN